MLYCIVTGHSSTAMSTCAVLVMRVGPNISVHCSHELSVASVLKAYLNFLPLAGIYPQVVPVNKGDHAL